MILFLVFLVLAWASSLLVVIPSKWRYNYWCGRYPCYIFAMVCFYIFWCSATYLEKILAFVEFSATYFVASLTLRATFHIFWGMTHYLIGLWNALQDKKKIFRNPNVGLWHMEMMTSWKLDGWFLSHLWGHDLIMLNIEKCAYIGDIS